MDDPKVVILLFGSGKIVITGGKTPADAITGVENVTGLIADLGLSG